MMMNTFHMGGTFWIILIILLVLVVGAFAITANSTSQDNNRKTKGSSKSAREIADERYANGEISRQEYQTIIQDIDG